MRETNERPKLLLEREAADILGYTCAKLKRLRLAGQLEFIDSRPVLFTEKALKDYLDQKQSDEEKLEKQRTRELSPKAWAMMAAFRQSRRRKPES